MLPEHLQRNSSEIAAIRRDIESGSDAPVLMVNLNTYKPEAGFPDGREYRGYIAALESVLESVGGRIAWRHPVLGQVVGEPAGVHEVLGIWFPSGEAFLALPKAPGADDSYRLRELCVERATIYRCRCDTNA